MFRKQSIVQTTLAARNNLLANFWFSDPNTRICPDLRLQGRRALIIDAEDSFTEMLSQQLIAIGLSVTVRKFNYPKLLEGDWDLVVMGPGPGDPRDMNDSRIVRLRNTLTELQASQQPFLAICLSHQILCISLGIDVIRKDEPSQGIQTEIDLFGSPQLVGFYNSYVGRYSKKSDTSFNILQIEISRDSSSNDIHALRGKNFVSLQFHPESILTRNGIEIIKAAVKKVLKHN